MKVFIGADHAGFEMKEYIEKHLNEKGHEVEDLGANSTESVDYPVFAEKVGKAVVGEEGSLGILVCGTGLGMCMASNKVNGVRAATCRTVEGAKLTREHNNANVLCLGARLQKEEDVIQIVDAFLATPFSGDERHKRRVDGIADLEG
ncbi:MAG: ribose 5-phosphate isomerase B [Candidatus Diapherotrites archaeon]